mgnify:CR=1 FL=1
MGIGISLSGGGIRGIAHAGVLKALEDNNIKVDAIAGTSAGSIVATLYAMGFKPYYIYILFKKYAKDIINIKNRIFLNGIKNYIKCKKIGLNGLNDGSMMENMYNELAKTKGFKLIGDIKMPLVISTVDIGEAKEYIFTNCAPRDNYDDKYITEVEIGKAVRASSSFPAIFCPLEYKKHLFMDGGVLDNIPTEELKKVYDGKIISVNFKADPVQENYDVMDIIMKTLDVMGNKLSENSINISDFVLTIPTDRTGLLDIKKMDKCFEYGYKTTIENLSKIKELSN